MAGKFLIATCPLCRQQLIFDTESPTYTTAHVTDVALAHYATHSAADWAREVQQLLAQQSMAAELYDIPTWAMPQA